MRRYVASSIAALVATSAVVLTVADATAQSRGGRQRDVTITIERVRALDAADAFSKADFFARVTVAGVSKDTPFVRQQMDISPNWQVTTPVAPGRHDITVEVFDRDLTKIEPIDINRVANKRKLDLSVDTRGCSIGGISGVSRCGQKIVRAGAEPKKAEITFTVNVAR